MEEDGEESQQEEVDGPDVCSSTQRNEEDFEERETQEHDDG